MNKTLLDRDIFCSMIKTNILIDLIKYIQKNFNAAKEEKRQRYLT